MANILGLFIHHIVGHCSGIIIYNYNFFSIVLMAVCVADYLFVYADVGAYGKTADSTIWRDCSLYNAMERNNLDLPGPQPITPHGRTLPMVFIGDEALGLHNHLQRPYSGKQLTMKKRVFNYRLSRARRYVKCSFGILSNKWRILHRPINVSIEFATDIVKACIVIHNTTQARWL